MILQRNVSFLLSPDPCAASDWMLVMVSSGPKNRELRDSWRQRMAEVRQKQGIKVVFLVANTTSSGDKERLEMEHQEEGDIVQCGVEVNMNDKHHLQSLFLFVVKYEHLTLFHRSSSLS